MPAFVGPVELLSIETTGVFTVGDAFSLSPKSTEKGSFGSGVGNTGDFTESQNLFSITKFDDSDVVDQSKAFNK